MNVATSKTVTVFSTIVIEYQYINNNKYKKIEVSVEPPVTFVTFQIRCCSNKYEMPSHPCVAFVLNTKVRWHH